MAITVDADNSIYGGVDGVVFDKSRTTLIRCPEGKTGNYAIPSSVTTIGNWAFESCTSLGSVTIPSGVTSIGNGAFSGCTSLGSVTIPSSVTSIGRWAFSGCASLTAITVDADNSTYGSVDGVVFDKSRTMLLLCPGGKSGNYTIPGSVTRIADYAFSGCARLASVTIPSSVTRIGEGTFQSCTGLVSVIIPSSVTSIGSEAFFGCTSLGSVTIPDSVTRIWETTFGGCTSLGSVYFRGNAPAGGEVGFDSADNVTVYYLPGTKGWGPAFGGRRTVLWNSQIDTSGARFGVQTNGFGFEITGTRNLVVVVEVCTELAHPVWSPVGTNILTDGSSYFSDPQWINRPTSVYRLRSP